MTDLAQRLRQIERNPSPDLWAEITTRTPGPPSSERRGLRHRVAAGLVAAVVSIAALVFLVSVFRPGDYRSGTPILNGASDVTLLVSSLGPSYDTALLTGTLTTDSGCVAVSGGPGSSVFVVWPDGYSLAEEGDDVWLVDHSGNRIAKIGDEVQMGGGVNNLAHAEPEVPAGIPSSCEVGGPDAYWFAGTPELVEGSATPTPSATEDQFFVPPTTTQGSTTTLPLVFPDGSRADLTYSADLLLAERGIAPNLLIHLDQGARCGWDGIIGYNTLRDVVYEGDGPTFSVEGESSHVEIWAGAKGYLPQYLVIREGSWEVTVPCPSSDLVEDEASTWADTLRLSTSPEGYLVVKATAPLVIEGPEAGASFSGPELYFLGGEPSVEGATGILSIGVATHCPAGEGVVRDPGWARRCFQTDGGAVIMTIQTEDIRPSERAYLDAVVEGVEVTDIVLEAVE